MSHRYGPRFALNGVTFDVASGECFGLLGPNGGGKSTLFRILSTLLTPTSGRATIDGDDVARDHERVRRKLGVVFQSPSLDVHLTVGENLLHAGHLYGLCGPDLAMRCEQVLAKLGVNDRRDDRVITLSGGLRRRVEIAKCLLHRPMLLILDEPATGLDPSARRELWEHLAELIRETGATILFTTHDMDEADRCDRLLMLDRGRVVATGRPAELKSQIGGNCVLLESADPKSLCDDIRQQFELTATVVDSTVRIETTDAGPLTARLLETLGAKVQSVTISRPTLADVYFRATGHAFEKEVA